MSSTNHFEKLAMPSVRGLHPYLPGKPIEELQRELGLNEIIKLVSNENPLGASPLAAAAARDAISNVNLYPDDIGFSLRNALARRYGVAADNITLGSGSSDVIDMVARSFLGPGRNAVFSEFSFAMYPIYTQACGAESKVAAALTPGDPKMPYGHDLNAMAAAVDENTRVVFIANPNNPTGTWLSGEALESFLSQLPADIIVVLDEAYTEYVEEEAYPNGLDWLSRFPNLIVTRTFSKIYGLAGLRVGYGVSNPELAALINRVRHPFNVNSVALAAAEASLDDHEFIERSVASNRQGMKQLAEGFLDLGLLTIPSVGNFICVELPEGAGEVNAALLKKGVIVRPLVNYRMSQHLRITVGSEEENLHFLKALASSL
jgi:histidinol-phosphate aminotransferase